MTAEKLEIQWSQEIWESAPIQQWSGGQTILRRIGVEPRQSKCPACGSIVYSRRQSVCGVCDAELPESCRFTESELQKVEALLTIERQRHRQWLRKAA